MIKSYGLFWRRKNVIWGKQNSSGKLLGAASRSQKAVSVDFSEQRGIYILYANFRIVYIGQTGAGNARLLKRLQCHTTDHLAERWNQFSWFGLEWVTKQHKLSKSAAAKHAKTQEILNIMEATLIATAEPPLNLQRGKWGDATQYFQVLNDDEV